MNYLFRAKDGSEVERDYPVGERPDVIRVSGRRYHHAICLSPGKAIIKNQPHLARSAPRKWTPGLAGAYDKWNERGVAVVEGAADERRFNDALKKIKPRNSWKYDP